MVIYYLKNQLKFIDSWNNYFFVNTHTYFHRNVMNIDKTFFQFCFKLG